MFKSKSIFHKAKMGAKRITRVPKGEEIDFQDLLRIDDIYSILDDADKEVQKQLNMDQTRADIKQRLIAAAKERGDNVNEALIEKSIDFFFQGLYTFKEPVRDLGFGLANAYIERVKIAKAVGYPLLGAAVIFGAAKGISNGAKELKLRAAESRVERAVEDAYQKKSSLESEIKTLSSKSIDKDLQYELTQRVNSSRQTLSEAQKFFDAFCDDGTAKDDITRENYGEVQAQLSGINGIISGAEQELTKGRELVDFHENMISTRQSLDSLIEEVRSEKPPVMLLSRAEATYKSGMASLANRQLKEGQSYREELKGLKDNVRDFSVLPDQADRVYQSIKGIAKEPVAIEEANRLYDEARAYINSINIPNLKQAVTKLEDINAVLKQEFVLRVVTRDGVKSGIDRYYTDEHGTRSSGYYLIVEAVDKNGNVLEQRITNEERSRTETVRMWGERVPEYIYERVKEDKLDDGNIQNNIVGEKKKGYLTIQITMPGIGKRAGQITEWVPVP
jgi:hypothetical protein